MNSTHRLSRLRQEVLAEREVFVSYEPSNVIYLTGFENVFDDEPSALVAVSSSAALIYTDGRYAEAACRAAEGTEFEVCVPAGDLFSAMVADLSSAGATSLALETTLSVARYRAVADQFDGEVVPLEERVEALRQVKEPEEIDRIVEAQRLTDACFDYIVGALRPGMTEAEVALEIEVWLRRHGSEGVAFPAIVAAGTNASRPHAKPGDREIAKGDLVVIDFGARVRGYCADMTRTVVLGPARERQREVYDAVLAANLAGTAAISAGVPGAKADAAARSVLEERGLGESFVHSLGHGVGLQVHELPSVSARATADMPEHAVVTVEPGVYLPGFGGVRIEDLVVVEQDGARVLTSSSKDLLEL